VFERIGELWLERKAPPAAGTAGRLLLVHGMWGGSWYWSHWLRRFAAGGWDAWALNLRGHHGSHPGTAVDGLGIDDYVEDVARCVAELGDVAVIGHSMGGLLVQKLAVRTRLRAAVFLTSAPPRGIVALRGPALARLWRYTGSLVTGRGFLPTPADARALLFNALPPDLARDACARLVPESGRAAREVALGLVAVDAARVRCPVLVVGAGLDRITPLATQRRIATRYGGELRVWPGHAHMPMLEDGWETAADALLGWLGAVAPHP
jgi:non-heme chloroperoxidase